MPRLRESPRRGRAHADDGTTVRAQRFANAWDAIADSPAQAARLRVRAELAHQVLAIVQAQGWTQAQAARRAGETRSMLSDLARGLIDRFTTDALVGMLDGLGAAVTVHVHRPRGRVGRAGAVG